MSANTTSNVYQGGEERMDGVDKVTGRAKYAAEHIIAGVAYGLFVGSTITKGKVTRLDVDAALASPGVLDVISYMNCPAIPGYGKTGSTSTSVKGFNVLADNIIRFYGQPIALVVADSFENARAALKLVKATYEKEPFDTHFEEARKNPSNCKDTKRYERGTKNAFQQAQVFVEGEYRIPIEVHNPMEMHATIAVWEGEDKLTLYDKTQGPKETQQSVARLFGIPSANVRVIAEYVGGAFGSALRNWPNVPAACIAAKKLNRPVKVLLTRPQMFNLVGYRPQSWQRVGIGADKSGKLTGITHKAISNTSRYEDFKEGIVDVSRFLYACDNVDTEYSILPLDLSTPTWMRGPGEASGCFALECALDELSYQLNMDPVDLRIKNFSPVNAESKLPWSANNLLECYEIGKKMIGWEHRPAKPRNLKEEDGWLGYGMSVGVFGAWKVVASVKATLLADGRLVLESAVSDMGPGTATAMVSIASAALNMPAQKIKFILGDSSLPPGPTQGGSGTTSTLGSAVDLICGAVKEELKQLAIKHYAGFSGFALNDLELKEEAVVSIKDASIKVGVSELLKLSGKASIELTKTSPGNSPRDMKYAMNSFSMHFVKLHVHEKTGAIALKHAVALGDAGKIINERTAKSQMIGGVVGGIGMALTEELEIDHTTGKISNASLSAYHVPLHPQIPTIEVWFVNKPDPVINSLGAKGLGEISLIGFAAAVANAVYNACGIRVRDLPITPSKLGYA